MTTFNCKFCSYCKKSGHSLSECWCTRPVNWNESPEYKHSVAVISNLLAPHPVRCLCGYPMPCSKNVPIDFCKAPMKELNAI